MELEKLDKVLEAILFVAGQGVPVSEIKEKLELQDSEMQRAIEKLQAKYRASCGIHIQVYNGKLQFCTNPAYADAVASVLNPIKEKELSRASLEVAAIIAYKQPITRLEIEQVRGVNSDYAVQMLTKHNLIQVVGRKASVGKPLLFGTTDEFLKRFNLGELSDLPDYEALLERIKIVSGDDGLPSDNSLFNFEETLTEALAAQEEIPDFLKGEKDLQKV